MKILVSLYNENYDTSETTFVYSKWIRVESGIEAIKTVEQYFANNGGYQYEAYFGQNLSFCDFYCFFNNAMDLIPIVDNLDTHNCDSEPTKFPKLFRICIEDQQIDEIKERHFQESVFLYYRSRYECGAQGLEDITYWMSAHPFAMVFIGGFIWDFTKWVFCKAKTAFLGKKHGKPIEKPFVFHSKKFYKSFEMLTKTKAKDCQIITFKQNKKGKYQLTVRTIKNELYKVCSSSSGIIESIKPIGIEEFHTKALQGSSTDPL